MQNSELVQALTSFETAVAELIKAETEYYRNSSVPEEWLSQTRFVPDGEETVVMAEDGTVDYYLDEYECLKFEVVENKESLPPLREKVRETARELRKSVGETGSTNAFFVNTAVGRILDLTIAIQEPAQLLLAQDLALLDDQLHEYRDMEGYWTPVGRKSKLLFDGVCQRLEDAVEELRYSLDPVCRVRNEPSPSDDVPPQPKDQSPSSDASTSNVGEKYAWAHDAGKIPPSKFWIGSNPIQPVDFKTATEMGFALHSDDDLTSERYQQHFRDRIKIGEVWVRYSRSRSKDKFEAFLKVYTSGNVKRVSDCQERILKHRQHRSNNKKAKSSEVERS